MYGLPKQQSDDDYVIAKYHGLIQDRIRENINKFNFHIQFVEEVWLLKSFGGGFTGHYTIKAVKIGTEPIGVLSVIKDKDKQCSKIHVWSDGACDGYNYFLINVPNGLFKRID